MLDRRLQILLDEERYQRISSLAKARGVSVAAVVRDAIDRGLPSAPVRRSAGSGRRCRWTSALPTNCGAGADDRARHHGAGLLGRHRAPFPRTLCASPRRGG
ncbi:CopG family transcriptional regulator [Pseudonocardia abyssalis]|uniref:Ribbon-helix-helix protein, CopG family n=1 Tax=Pseudonocardia abyssalis TaxID=2792008 RepID=A0ABS6UTD6_9PSEU|nr:ribbon-helix-helix protein, CopG family [Pseudonocardia abyssalis]MBW0135511.1 ribbon-helix-helix protein, CopG family [Pseudonocardia abyssalis]